MAVWQPDRLVVKSGGALLTVRFANGLDSEGFELFLQPIDVCLTKCVADKVNLPILSHRC